MEVKKDTSNERLGSKQQNIVRKQKKTHAYLLFDEWKYIFFSDVPFYI